MKRLLLALYASLLICAFSGGYWLADARADSARGAAASAAALAAEAAGSAAARAIAANRATHTITKTVIEKETHEKPVFVDCRSGPDSMRAFNAAIPAEPSTARGGVPGAASTD